MHRLVDVPWRMPAIMLGSFFAAFFIAIGQHCYYRHINDTTVDAKQYRVGKYDVTGQQITTATGTALAFLFNAALSLAASIAYMQLFFHKVVGKPDSSLGKLDLFFSGLGDLSSLAQLTLSHRYWLLSSTALVIWLLPFPAVFTPAALTVEPSPNHSNMTDYHDVAETAFASFALTQFVYKNAAQFGDGLMIQMSADGGPAVEVLRIAAAAATTGSILPIPSQHKNATWQLDLELPQVTCAYVDKNNSAYEAIRQNLYGIITDTLGRHGIMDKSLTEQKEGMLKIMFTYISWLAIQGDQPFVTGTHHSRPILQTIDNMLPKPRAGIFDLYIGIFDKVSRAYNEEAYYDSLNEDLQEMFNSLYDEGKLLRCSLGAGYYKVEVSYSGTDQRQSVEILSVTDLPLDSQDIEDYTPLFIGEDEFGDPHIFDKSGKKKGTPLNLRPFSYSSVWQAFTTLVIGGTNVVGGRLGRATLAMDWVTDETEQRPPGWDLEHIIDTQVFTTSLGNTVELASVSYNQTVALVNPKKNQHQSSWYRFWEFSNSLQGPGPITQKIVHLPLKEGLQELFFNITVSLSSSPLLQHNKASGQIPVEVHYQMWGLKYHYASSKLWLSYGLALGAVSVNICIGLWSIYSSGASFSPSFSTIVRIAKNSQLVADDVSETYPPGKDPLPEHLKTAALLHHHEVTSSGPDEEQAFTKPDEASERESSIFTDRFSLPEFKEDARYWSAEARRSVNDCSPV